MKKTIYVVVLALFAFLMFGCDNVTQAKSEKPTAPKSSTVAPTKSATKSTTTSKNTTESKKTSSTEAPHTHVWDGGSVTTPQTCTEKGVMTFTCACGETKTEEIDALGHDLVDDAAIPATCTAPGKEAGKHCSRCEYTEGGAEVEALGHDYTVEVENTAQAATCTAPGKEADHKCSRCDSVETGAEITALGHDLVDDEAIPATCTAPGKEPGKHCSRCEYTEGGAEVEVLGHDYTVEVENTAKAATCTAPGKEADMKCSRCDSVETGAEIAALGHDYQKVDAVAPTHDAFGSLEHYECSRCHTLALDQNGAQVVEEEDLVIAKLLRVTFDTDDGSTINAVDVAPLTTAAALADFVPTKTGYTFSKWMLVNGDQLVDIKSSDVVPSDITVKAIYTPNTDTAYIVKHNLIKADGTYEVLATDNLTGTTLEEVTASPKENDYYYDANVSTVTGNIAADGSLVLDLYYRTKYTITSTTELKNIINNMYGYYTLSNDLDFWNGSNRRFNEPIGLNAGKQTTEEKPFYGIFDGQGHKIQYEYSYGGVNANNHDRGLFYVIGSTAVVKNLALVVGTDSNNGVRRSALAWRNYGLVENVYVDITYNNTAQAANPNSSAAGLVNANLAGGIINNCFVKLTYTSTNAINNYMGGICYQNVGTVSNSAFVAIVANNSAGTISDIPMKDGKSTNTNIVSGASQSEVLASYEQFKTNGFKEGMFEYDGNILFFNDIIVGELVKCEVEPIDTILIQKNGEAVQLNPVFVNEGNFKLKYTSSNPELVTVSDTGLITVANNKVGDTIINLSYGTFSMDVVVVVYTAAFDGTNKTPQHIKDTIEADMSGYYIFTASYTITNGNSRFLTPIGLTTSAGKGADPTTGGAYTDFTGTINGLGHILTYTYNWGGTTSDNHDKYFIYSIGSTGVVKNLGLKAKDEDTNTNRRSTLCCKNAGLVYNCYLEYVMNDGGASTNTTYCKSGVCDVLTGTIDNCVVFVNNAGATNKVLSWASKLGSTSKIINSGVLRLGPSQNQNIGDTGYLKQNLNECTTAADLITGLKANTHFVCGEYWQITDSAISFDGVQVISK